MLMNIIAAVLLDFILGDPYSFPHPVKLMGRIISLEDKLARKIDKSKLGLKIAGLIIVIMNICFGFFISYFLLKFIKQYKVIYNIINIYLIYTCIAARSLHYEAMKVYQALDIGIKEARTRLSYIVGRETKNLSEEKVMMATVETVAENTSDGVIVPLFFIMLFGVPGGLAYKFINTMDSMLGYMNEKYIDIGYFPAKTDDLFNYIPARITGLLMSIGSIGRFDIKNGFRIMIRDRKNHKSPNAVYPEAAVAGLLGIQLGGNNYYHGKLVEKPTIGDKLENINKNHIKNTIEIMYRSQVLILIIYSFVKLKII
ncbi:adenosylcobinamide-phosphate synthase CbiB [Schnuerera sp. xch1]|uniref:adenosylcobinamide-phosphate synthase CbiB n=1 Tax=Schnuerera sp. xch1 TaxID=2874283 RepID=UPI001CC163AB|nr:adenosylcobinamide-phosphate synthase CbiB [Schnuerera sp. xch1]MBZ2175525.1 adenosylcobinamide-phosphate synthase CbiB [Schnuerera sp. xch1]